MTGATATFLMFQNVQPSRKDEFHFVHSVSILGLQNLSFTT
jgi:hypothetical protein